METHPLDEDTLLTTTYCLIDDLYRTVATHARRRGPPPALSDSEVLALTVLAQIKHLKSERRLIRHAREHWRAYFPHLVSQNEFNRRARDLMSLLACITSRLAHATEMTYGLSGAFEVIDGTPLPVMRRCRAKREHSFTPDADFGWGGSDRDQYYGLKLLVSVTESGFITGFLAGPANTEERWLAEALLRYRTDVTAIAPSSEQMRLVLGPTHKSGGERKGPSGRLGPRYGVGEGKACLLADLNYRGRSWQRHWCEAYGVRVLTPSDVAASSKGVFRAWRQVVESAVGRLNAFGLAFPLAKSIWGAWQRLSAKVMANNLTLTINLLHHRPLHATLN